MYDMSQYVGCLPTGEAVFIGDVVYSNHAMRNVTVAHMWIDEESKHVFIQHSHGIALLANCLPATEAKNV